MSTRKAPSRRAAASGAPAPRPAAVSAPATAPTPAPGVEAPAPLSEARQAGFTHRNLPLLLLQVREAVISRFRPVLGTHGLTEQQWRIIRALLERGPLEPRQIVEICNISSPSLTGILARMTDTGWVLRERMAHDQRRVLMSLTDQSRALAASLAPQIEAIYQGLAEQVGAEFMAHFYATLDELLVRLGSPGDAGTWAEE